MLTTPSEIFLQLPIVFILAILVHLLGPVIMSARLKGRGIDNATRGAFYTCVTFTNGVPFVTLFSIAQMFLFLSLGSAIGSEFGEKDTSQRQIVGRALVFTPLFAVILATVLSVCGSSLPGSLVSVLPYGGPVTTYLSLVTAGLGAALRL